MPMEVGVEGARPAGAEELRKGDPMQWRLHLGSLSYRWACQEAELQVARRRLEARQAVRNMNQARRVATA